MQFPNTHNSRLKIHLSEDSPTFDQIYLENFAALHRYAYTIINDRELAEEMVHQVFLKILEQKEALKVHTSIKAYLFRAVNNECLNHIKHQKVKQSYQTYAIESIPNQVEIPSNQLAYKELEKHLTTVINGLPEQCRTIFQLSRFEELKYREIANQLGISIKTVESQMSKAIKRLRVELADYLPIIVWMLIIRLWH